MKKSLFCVLVAATIYPVNANRVMAQNAGPATQPARLSQLDEPIRAEEIGLNLLSDQLAELRARSDAVQNDLQGVTGRVENSAATLRQSAAALDEQIQSLQLEDAASGAKISAIENEIAKASRHAADRADGDAVLTELAKVVDLRQKDLEAKTTGYTNHTLPSSEARAAEVALAEAKAQLAVQRERVVASSGGDVVGSLEKELIDLHIAKSERDARLKLLEERLDRLGQGLRRLPALEELQARLARVQAQAADMQDELRKNRLDREITSHINGTAK